jgi:hypothetical protein
VRGRDQPQSFDPGASTASLLKGETDCISGAEDHAGSQASERSARVGRDRLGLEMHIPHGRLFGISGGS